MSIERYSISSSSIVGWGRRIDKNNDYVAVQALKFMESVNLVVPGAYILESLPWLQMLPSWLYALPHAIKIGSAIGARYFYMLTEESMGNYHKAFNATMMKAQEDHKMTDLEVAGLMANIIGGGVDTTSSTMVSCILAMCAFPEVQKKAQEELDRVIGHDRSPDWSDIDGNKLPYLTAVVKETLRWRTVTVLSGIPHANTAAVDYRGYHFPAGTNFTCNMWAIHRNPVDFPEPDNFVPERFLDGPWKKPYPNAKGSNPFGWGRRQCSGQPLAEQGLLYSLGRIIWAFNIEPGLSKDASFPPKKPPDPHLPDIFAYTESENMRPEAFPVRYRPRSEKIKSIVMEELAVAREALRTYDGETKLTMADAVSRPCFD
ncbi:cytochrome P450 [Sarocladium strictum]